MVTQASITDRAALALKLFLTLRAVLTFLLNLCLDLAVTRTRTKVKSTSTSFLPSLLLVPALRKSTSFAALAIFLRCTQPNLQHFQACVTSCILPSYCPHIPVLGSENHYHIPSPASISLLTFHHRLNRISAPVTNFDLSRLASSDVQDLHNTAAFVLDDEDKTSLSMEHNPNKFPMLIRRSTGAQQQLDTSVLTALASQQSPEGDKQSGAWPAPSKFSRHRSQQSVPLTAFGSRTSMHGENYDSSQLSGLADTPTKTAARHSMEVGFGSQPFENKRSSVIASPSNGTASNGAPKLTSSFSTNDIPTLKGSNGMASLPPNQNPAAKTHAEQHFHHHNASIGRIPPNPNNRHSREMSADLREDLSKTTNRPGQSVLQANAAPFGPTSSAGNSASVTPTSPAFQIGSGATTPNNPAFYGGYGMPMLNAAFTNLNLGSPQAQWNNQMQMQMFQPPTVEAYQRAVTSYGNGRVNDSQARVIAQRRQQQNEGKCIPR